MKKQEILRIHNIILKAINQLNLDLSGETILTEVGSGYFVFTPIIALMANAKKVYAWVRDSNYGTGEEISKTCDAIVKEYGLQNNIEYSINSRPENHIKNADIITNLGFVRPLHSEFLKLVSPQTAIAGMCEAWELRAVDIDLNYCKQKGIKVAGTWENHPELKIFDGCGHLAVKMAQEAGYEVYQNNIIVWSNDHFGEVISNEFKKFGATSVIQTTNVGKLYEEVAYADFIFFCDYHEQRKIIGEDGFIKLDELQKLNKGLGIVHLYGEVDHEEIIKNGLHVYPTKKGRASVMTFTLAHLGPIPIINLHAAGLKVGESLRRNANNNLVQLV